MVHILPFDRAAAETFGNIRAGLERAGTPLAKPNLGFGAIALINNLPVVTSRARHFARILGLQVESWTKLPDSLVFWNDAVGRNKYPIKIEAILLLSAPSS